MGLKKANKKWEKARRDYLKSICRELIKKGYKFSSVQKDVNGNKSVITLEVEREI